ncbi:hypothetical protein [Aeromonas veronii]|uniref:hypothetical protein n=1 Tax=Aeromonas veronii TaxID=654 RepID=UPI003D2483F2
MWRKYTKKTFFLLLSIVVSSLFSYFLQPLVKGSSLDVLVNIYSILAGFLIGVIALIGDPSSLPTGSWRIAEHASKNTFRSLNSTKNLLHAYFITSLLIFIYKLVFIDGFDIVNKITPFGMDIHEYVITAKVFMEHSILFFSSIAFIYSLKLPGKLFSIQQARVSKEIDSRKKPQQ